MKHASVRIVIPCRQTDETIETCLRAIDQSNGVDFEIVVVDDGRNTLLESLGAKYDLTIVRSGDGVGAGAARNAGARGFTGSILVFIDADVEIIQPDTIALLIEPINAKQAAATVGRYSGVRRRNVFETYKHRYLAYTYKKGTRNLSNTFWTALCAVDREWFEAMGGFKERYSWAGPEDIEFGIELTKHGGTILAVPGSQGHHLASLDFRRLLANDLRKGTEDIYVHWMRNIALTDNRHVTKTDILAVVLASIFLGLWPFYIFVGFIPIVLSGTLYLVSRVKLLYEAYRGEGLMFLVQSAFLVFVLDIIRAAAVVVGTWYWMVDRTKKSEARYS
jgi:GT2 family glycosyltransferase